MTRFLTALTLVDITNTGVTRIRDNNKIEYHQQQNLNVLLQTIGLRAQLFDPKVVVHPNSDLTELQFGDVYGKERACVWALHFYIEHGLAWSDGIDNLAFFKSDAHRVAITPDLKNTIEFPINIFDTQDNVNLYFTAS